MDHKPSWVAYKTPMYSSSEKKDGSNILLPCSPKNYVLSSKKQITLRDFLSFPTKVSIHKPY